MWNDEDRRWLYEQMQSNGVDTGSYEEFSQSLSDEDDLNWYYDKSRELGLDVGDMADFRSMMVEPSDDVEASVPTTPAPQQATPRKQVVRPAQKPSFLPQTSRMQDRPGAATMSQQRKTALARQDATQGARGVNKAQRKGPEVGRVVGDKTVALTFNPNFKPSLNLPSQREMEARAGLRSSQGSRKAFDIAPTLTNRNDQILAQGLKQAATRTEPSLEHAYEHLRAIEDKVAPLEERASYLMEQLARLAQIDAPARTREKYERELEELRPQLAKLRADRDAARENAETFAEMERKRIDPRSEDEKAKELAHVLAQGSLYHGHVDTTDEGRMRESASRQLERRIEALDAGSRSDFGFWQGLWRAVSNPSTWTFGLTDLADVNMIDRAMSSQGEESEGSVAEELLRQTVLAGKAESDNDKRIGHSYRFGLISGQALPFVAEFWLTGGFSGIAKGISKAGTRASIDATRSSLGRALIKATGRNILGRGVKLGSTFAQDVTSAALMANTTGAMKTMTDITRRNRGKVVQDEDGNYEYKEGKPLGQAIYEGEASNILEYYTEMLGAHMDKPLSVIGKWVKDGTAETMGLANVSTALSHLSRGGFGRIAAQTLERAQIQGYPGEVLEEEVNMLLNALLVGDNKVSDLWDADKQIDILGGMAFSIGFMQSMPVVGSGIDAVRYYNTKRKMERAGRTASFRLTGERWQPLQEQIDGTTNDEMQGLWSEIYHSDEYAPQEKKAICDYIINLLKYRGYNEGMSAKAREQLDTTDEQEQQVQESENTINASYVQGHEMTEPEGLAEAKSRYDFYRLLIGDFVSDDMQTLLDANPLAALDIVRNDDTLTKVEKQSVVDYLNAKSVYDGMQQRVEDDADAMVDEQRAAVDMTRHDADGGVHPAVMKDGRAVFIVAGRVEMMQDGSMVDAETSDDYVVIFDPATGEREMISPASDTGIASLGEVESTEAVEAGIEQAREEYVAQQEAVQDGVLSFVPGETYSLLIDGEVMEATVNEDRGETVLVSFKDGNTSEFFKDDVQALSDAFREQKIKDGLSKEEAAEGTSEETQPVGSESEPDGQIDVRLGRSLSGEETSELIAGLQDKAEQAEDVALTPENWLLLFGEDGKVVSPIGEVTMGENQYFKLAQQGRDGKLGMVKPTLETPDVIIEDERPAQDGQEERPTSYVFVKTFVKPDGVRYYYFTSVTVSKDGHEVVISNQEKSANRISRLLQQGKIVWINSKFSPHPTAGVGESVPVNDSNRPTFTDNQPALLGVGSSELSAGKGSENNLNGQINAAENIREQDGNGGEDRQGNRLNSDGSLYLESVESVDEISDEDFDAPLRSVSLSDVPQNVRDALGAGNKAIIIKKNIFERNGISHPDLTAEQSRDILRAALYNPTLYGQNQKNSRPYNWVVINTTDKSGQNRLVLLEVNQNKDNVEIVHWHYLDSRGLEKLKRQADREDGQLLILPSVMEEVGALSDPTDDLSSAGKGSENNLNGQINAAENEDLMPMTVVRSGRGANAKEDQVPDWAAAGAERSYRYLYEETGVERDDANAIVKNNLDEAKRQLEAKEKSRPKPKTNPIAFMEEMRQWKADMEQLQGNVELWQDISREAQAELLAQQREAADQARLGNRIKQLGEPVTLEDELMRALYGGGIKMVWADDPTTRTKGLGGHLGPGHSSAERRQRSWMLASREKGGLYPEEVAERLHEDADPGTPLALADEQEVFNTLLAVALRYPEKKMLGEAILDLASRSGDSHTSEEEEYQKEQFARSMGFDTFDEWDAYESAVAAALPRFTEQEENILSQIISEEYERDNKRKSSDGTVQGGSAVLPAAEAGIAGRSGKGEVEQTGPTEAGVEMPGGLSKNIGKSAGQSDLAKTQVIAPLSEEVNEDDNPFILSSDGTTSFGEVTEESGLTAAPIKLSLGENTVDENGENHGYGLLHIEAGHGEQIRSAGYSSVVEFVETVAKNYDTIREGNVVANNQTYLLELSDGHNNTLFVQLSKDGSYWNVNSAGIFRKKYSRRKAEVASLPTIGNSSSTETVEVNRGQTKGATATSENSSLTSAGKGSEISASAQGKGEKNGRVLIQGLDGYTEDEVLSLVRADIEEKLADAGVEGVTLNGMALHGSRLRGDAREDSDLDVVVEYDGDISEDGLFNMLNDEPLEIEGVRVDINPITKGKSGTLEQYMERSRVYDALKSAEQETDTEPTEAQKEAGSSVSRDGKTDSRESGIQQTASRADAVDGLSDGGIPVQGAGVNKRNVDAALSDYKEKRAASAGAFRRYGKDASLKSEWDSAFQDEIKSKQSLRRALHDVSDEELERLESDEIVKDLVLDERRRRNEKKWLGEEFEDGLAAQGSLSAPYKAKVLKGNDFADTLENRPIMNGVFHDPDGYGVASDGKILLASRSLYDKNHEGKTVATHKVGAAKAGDEIEGAYPKWKSVVASNKGDTGTDVDWDALNGFLAGVAKDMKERHAAYKQDGGKDSFAKWSDNASVQVRMPNGEIFRLTRIFLCLSVNH